MLYYTYLGYQLHNVCENFSISDKIWAIFMTRIATINRPAPTATEQVDHIVGCAWKEEEVMDGLDFRKNYEWISEKNEKS